MSPDGLDVTQTGLTHGVGPTTSSMMSASTSSFNLASTFALKLKGICLGFCDMGVMSGSMWMLALYSFSFNTDAAEAFWIPFH